MTNERKVILTVEGEMGLHARPAALISKMARTYTADILIGCGNGKASAKSIIGILSLGVAQGEEITLTARGTDADEAIRGLSRLFASDFAMPAAQKG